MTESLIRLKRGMYVVAPEVSGKMLNEMLIANSLYGPSYVSYSSALHHYGLIDDVAQTIYSATLKREKQYDTPIGRFVYVKPSGTVLRNRVAARGRRRMRVRDSLTGEGTLRHDH